MTSAASAVGAACLPLRFAPALRLRELSRFLLLCEFALCDYGAKASSLRRTAVRVDSQSALRLHQLAVRDHGRMSPMGPATIGATRTIVETSDWPAIVITGVTAVLAALGAVFVKEHFDRRSTAKECRDRAHQGSATAVAVFLVRIEMIRREVSWRASAVEATLAYAPVLSTSFLWFLPRRWRERLPFNHWRWRPLCAHPSH